MNRARKRAMGQLARASAPWEHWALSTVVRFHRLPRMAKKKNSELKAGDRVEVPILIQGKDGKHAKSVRFGHVVALEHVAVLLEGDVNPCAIPMSEVKKLP